MSKEGQLAPRLEGNSFHFVYLSVLVVLVAVRSHPLLLLYVLDVDLLGLQYLEQQRRVNK
jgi:hypothetical protein